MTFKEAIEKARDYMYDYKNELEYDMRESARENGSLPSPIYRDRRNFAEGMEEMLIMFEEMYEEN